MKILRKNWEASKEKWGGKIILQKMKDKVPFDSYDGWNDLMIATIENCGYCLELTGQSCHSCSLYEYSPIREFECGKYFEGFIDSMRDNNFSKAEWHRVRLYNQILADEKNVYEEKEDAKP